MDYKQTSRLYKIYRLGLPIDKSIHNFFTYLEKLFSGLIAKKIQKGDRELIVYFKNGKAVFMKIQRNDELYAICYLVKTFSLFYVSIFPTTGVFDDISQDKIILDILNLKGYNFNHLHFDVLSDATLQVHLEELIRQGHEIDVSKIKQNFNLE